MRYDAAMTVNVKTTMNPTVTITVSDQEYADLVRQGLIYSVESGLPIDRLDFTPDQYAEMGVFFAPPRRVAPAAKTNVTIFAAGHGWTRSGAGSTDLNATADPALGSQYVRITTGGTTGAIIHKVGLPAMDLSNVEFAVLARVSDPTKLANSQVYLGKNGMTNYETLTFMSNQVGIVANEWTWLHFSWAELLAATGTPDRTAITDINIRVADLGTGTITVDVNAIAFFPKNTRYPNGVVSFGFDDSYASAFTKAAPKLDQYGYAGNLYPIIDRIDQAGLLTLADAKKLVNLHGWAVGAHAYSTANHNAGFPALSVAQVEYELRLSRIWLQANGFNMPDCLAWPLGQSNAALEELAARYFPMGRANNNILRGMLPPAYPMRRRAYPITSATTLATLTAEVDKAHANGLWLDLIFHDIVDSGASGTSYPTATFNSLVDYIAAKPIPVATDRDIMKTLAA